MRVPLSWLKEYVDISDISAADLAERLTTAGLEVASVEYIGVPGPAGSSHLVWDRDAIRVGEILSVNPHPDADRLRLVTVEYGTGEPKTVVTGAPNVAAGQRVAYAVTGATVINGYSEAREHVTLKPKKLRGVLSEGMVLSERELGLSDQHEGILELASDAPVGKPLQDYLGDVVLDIELTPNIVGHAASIVGVAREVAALLRRELRKPSYEVTRAHGDGEAPVRIVIEVPELNPRFTATLIRDIEVTASPFWMQRRLILGGQRPINNIVDITNYVMLELGQPLHAFDYDVLVERARRSGEALPTILMRTARPGETLTTLDGKVRTLDPGDVLVTDSQGIISMAGIMGGLETEVSEKTRNVLLEAAAWNFIAIRRSATRHSLHSEAAYRFSRNVHPAMALRGNRRAAMLMADLGGGQIVGETVDAYPNPPASTVINLDPARVNRLLGTRLSREEITDNLSRLEFEVEAADDVLRVMVPDYRTDITIPADLVEEVARVHGLENLPLTLMADALPSPHVDRALQVEEKLRDLLVACGLTETISYSMTAPEREAALLPDRDSARDASDAGYVCLANPISQERRVMRRSLLASVVETAGANLRHRDRVALFEIGSVYLSQGEMLPDEERRVAIVMSGPSRAPGWHRNDSRPFDFFDLKGIIEEVLEHLYLSERATFEPSNHPSFQPGRAATVRLDGETLGEIGELHPIIREANSLGDQRVVAAELDLDVLIAAIPERVEVRPIPRFPSLLQDLAAVVTEDTTAHEVEMVIREVGGPTLTNVQLFDLYRGSSIPEGTKSLAFSLQYSDPERTLTDEDVATIHGAIADALRTRLGARIRGEDL